MRAPAAERGQRVVRAPRGSQISCKGWPQEAALRMLMNNLDPEVAERPQDLVVYGGIGEAARNWECFDAIVRSLRELEGDQTLLVQSGKPVGVFKTHAEAPRVLIANSMLVPAWATWDHFNELDRKGLAMYGQMTAGSWIYIGTQGILQGTYETFAEAARQHFGGTLKGRLVVTAGLGGMGGAQPLAATLNEGVIVVVEVDARRIQRRLDRGRIEDLPESIQGIIAARLDALPREEKDLLQDAAVVGKVFWSGALGELRHRDRAEVEVALHALERKEFVRRERRSSVAGLTEYAFRHILVRDVAYGQIPRGDRADRHARTATWIDALGRSADHAELLAGHWLAALELARAAGRPTEAYVAPARAALLEAGDRALALNAFDVAARYLRAALDLMSLERPERPSAMFRYAKAVHISEGGAGPVLQDAEAALRGRGDLATAAEAAVLQAESAWDAGDGAATAAHLRRAAELVDGLPPSYSTAYVLSDLCRYHMLAGRSEESIQVGLRALAMAAALGLDDIRAHALASIGTARSRLDDPAGEADFEEAIALSRAGNFPDLARALNNLAAIRARRGELRDAGELWREARQAALDFGNPTLAHFVRSNLALSDYAAGRWDEALRAGVEMIAEFEAGRVASEGPLTRFIGASINLARGDVDRATEAARIGLAAARRSGNPQDLVPALATQGTLMLELGRPDEANGELDELVAVVSRARGETAPEFGVALAVAGRSSDLQAHVETMPAGLWRDMHRAILAGDLVRAARVSDEAGSLPVAARLRLLAADRLLERGQPEAARSELDVAVDFWQSVDARYWLGRAAEVHQRIEAALSSEATRTAP